MGLKAGSDMLGGGLGGLPPRPVPLPRWRRGSGGGRGARRTVLSDADPRAGAPLELDQEVEGRRSTERGGGAGIRTVWPESNVPNYCSRL